MENHKEHLNAHKLYILRRMANHVRETQKNEVPLSVLKDNINDYNNAQKLRYHAVIFKIKRGTWGITAHGWDFLAGNKDLSKYVYVADNHIVAKSEETINVRDLNRGEVVIFNKYDYYTPEGEYLNTRPTNSLQTSLV